jgi:hypothetical protein
MGSLNLKECLTMSVHQEYALARHSNYSRKYTKPISNFLRINIICPHDD